MTSMRSIHPDASVYVVDDEAPVRRLLVEVLSSLGLQVHSCESGEAFLQAFRRDDPCCVLLDVRMPRVTGPEVHDWLASEHPGVPVIFLTGFADVSTAVRAMHKGAFDFIEKPFNVQHLIEVVHDALRKAAQHPRRPTDGNRWLSALTPREREVLAGIVAGKRNKIIAVDLGISERTVETHRANLMEKAGVNNVTQLVAMAIASGV